MIGFIGTGNMSQAIMGGIIKSNLYSASDIYGFDLSDVAVSKVNDLYKINMVSVEEVIKNSKYIFLGIKPYQYEKVIKEISSLIEDKVIISIAPLQTIDKVREYAGRNIKVVSSMPNTPALVGEGMSAVCFSDNIDDESKKVILSLFSSFGEVEEVEENLFNSVIAVSGSSPAYVYMFIEALADGAVKYGMSREKAYKFASQAVLGSAKMVLETGEHPAKLKDNVCSPGGTTIEAVASLEKSSFKGSVIEAMECCINKLK